jgi:hypothetical protein
MTTRDDVRFVIRQKSEYFASKVYDICSQTESHLYVKTRSLARLSRRDSVLKGWDDCRERHLVPLVVTAVASWAEVYRLLREHSAAERASLIERHIIEDIIEPAVRRVRNWFRWACDGPPITQVESGQTLKNILDNWTLPPWLNSPRARIKRQNGKWLFYSGKKHTVVSADWALQWKARTQTPEMMLKATKEFLEGKQTRLALRLDSVLKSSLQKKAERLLPSGTVTQHTSIQEETSLRSEQPNAKFLHSVDYTRLTIEGKEHGITNRAAAVIRTLHEAALTNDPWRTAKQIKEAIKEPASETKIDHWFRQQEGKTVYRRLVKVQGKRYRFNSEL